MHSFRYFLMGSIPLNVFDCHQQMTTFQWCAGGHTSVWREPCLNVIISLPMISQFSPLLCPVSSNLVDPNFSSLEPRDAGNYLVLVILLFLQVCHHVPQTWNLSHIFYGQKFWVSAFLQKKSRIRETLNLSTDADHRTGNFSGGCAPEVSAKTLE